MAKVIKKNPEKKQAQSTVPSFPLEIYPEEIRAILKRISAYKKYSSNYLAVSFLIACGSAFDRKFLMDTPNNHTAFPALWVITVGNAGASKSGPMDDCFRPFYKYTEEELQAYEEAKKQITSNGSPMINGRKVEVDQPNVRITSNATTESLISICSKQNHGILVHTDEILSFINGMDAYRSGKQSIDKPFWLSAYNGNPYIATRKTSGTSMVKNTTISIIGSIQYGQLTKAFQSSQDTSGFLDRFLFVLDRVDPPKWELNKAMPANLMLELHGFIDGILRDKSIQTRIRMTEEAQIRMIEWQNLVVDEMISEMNEAEVSAAKKDEIYINRLSLLLHLIKAHNQSTQSFPPAEIEAPVGVESVEDAIKLLDYFKENREIIKATLQEQSQELDYVQLKNEIRTAKGKKQTLKAIVQRWRGFGVPKKWFTENIDVDRTTIYRWLKEVK